MLTFKNKDKIFNYLKQEHNRQKEHLELIASENFASSNVIAAAGSILTNKYAEGYPGKRYYGGCQFVDLIETETIERAKKLFNVKYANVQPHSGSSANLAVFKALLNIGDTILSMNLEDGGHLTHGHTTNFSGKDYNAVFYGLNKETELLDYDKIQELANVNKPKLIIAGYSAYPRTINFEKFKKIADSIGAYLLVDMAHIAGLVAAGVHPSPIPFADVITSTTHKTLRGPRGGIILTNNSLLIKKINSAIFPGIQGGPFMHIIAAKGIAFQEAFDPGFVDYQKQVIANAKVLAGELKNLGYKIISGGTDNHLLLVDVKTSLGVTGKFAQEQLELSNITCNKNTVPNETESPFVTSGIRLGTPALTSRGFKEKEIKIVAKLIDDVLRKNINVKEKVIKLTSKFKLREDI